MPFGAVQRKFLHGLAHLRQFNAAGLICICALDVIQPEAREGMLVLKAGDVVMDDLIKLLHSYSHPEPKQEGLDFDI